VNAHDYAYVPVGCAGDRVGEGNKSNKRETMKKLVPFVLLALVVGVTPFLWADQESYRGAREVPSQLSGGPFDGGDSLTATDAVRTVDVDGNPTMALNLTFSASGATCQVHVYFYHGTTILGHTEATATATTDVNPSSRYLAEPLYFDTMRAQLVDVRFEDPSSGDVQCRPILYGAATKGAD